LAFIRREYDVGGRERLTADEERVLWLNGDEVMQISRLRDDDP